MRDRRQFERFPVMLPGTLSILIPENTFQPVENDCTVLDLSERGAMVNVKLPPEIYREMLQRTRYCRLRFMDDDLLPDRVIARAVWLEPHGSKIALEYRIGLFFEDSSAETYEQLRNYLHKNKTPQKSS